MDERRRKLVRVAVGLLKRESVFFCPDQISCESGTVLIVSRSHGLDWGVVLGLLEDNGSEITESALRIATIEDLETIDECGASEDDIEDFYIFAKECDLYMRLVGVDHSFDKSKVTFYYIAEGRVDFRELVKKLNKKYQRRVELYQLNLEDQFLQFPTCGICGMEVCCRKLKGVFGMKVSSRICKDQKLVYNPLKMSGCCGKARCCYVYEHPNYMEFADTLPKIGGRIVFRGHEWKLADWDIFRRAVLLYNPEYGRDFAVPWDEFILHFDKSAGEPLDLHSLFGPPPLSRERFGSNAVNEPRKTSEHMQGVSERYEAAIQSENGASSETNGTGSVNNYSSRGTEPDYHKSYIKIESPDTGTDKSDDIVRAGNAAIEETGNGKSVRPGQDIRRTVKSKPRHPAKHSHDRDSNDRNQGDRTSAEPRYTAEARTVPNERPARVAPVRNVRKHIRHNRPPRRPDK